MSSGRVKATAELVGVLAVLVTLILIWVQLRQSQLIAVAEFNVSLLEVGAETAALIGDHAEVWVRGSAGEQLTEAETEVFEQIAQVLGTRWFVEHRHMTRLGELEQAEAILNDWAAFLYEHPGLRQYNAERDQELLRNRELLSPGAEASFGWSEAIQAKLQILDDAR